MPKLYQLYLHQSNGLEETVLRNTHEISLHLLTRHQQILKQSIFFVQHCEKRKTDC